MDDLPNTNQSTAPIPPQPPSSQAQVGSMAKEVVLPTVSAEVAHISEVGRETELPPDVKNAGVTLQSDTIELPKPVAHMGVTSVHPANNSLPEPVISLPLSEDQIALGLHQSLFSSWRWLAQWCTRQLAIAHGTFKIIHSKIRSLG